MAAVIQVELTACDLNQLYAYMEQSPGLTQIMLQLLPSTCNHLTVQLRRIALYDRCQRIASLLLPETAAPDYDRGIASSNIPYTQEDLTLTLNFSRVTVNRVLSEWKKKGIVTASYGKTTILKRISLEALLPVVSPKHLTC